MHTTCEFLDAVKARHALQSDYALAKTLGVTHQMTSGYRAGKVFLGDSTAIKVANLLEIDPAIVIAAVHGERAKRPDEKAVWHAMLERLSGVAATVLIGVTALLPAPPAEAATGQNNPPEIGIMSTRRRYTKRHRPATNAALNPLEVFFLRKPT